METRFAALNARTAALAGRKCYTRITPYTDNFAAKAHEGAQSGRARAASGRVVGSHGVRVASGDTFRPCRRGSRGRELAGEDYGSDSESTREGNLSLLRTIIVYMRQPSADDAGEPKVMIQETARTGTIIGL